MKNQKRRHRSYQMNRLELVRTVSVLSSLLKQRGWSVTDAFVMGSQVSNGKPPHMKSDLDLLLMINEIERMKTPPQGLQNYVDDCVMILEEQVGREIHAQTVSPDFHPSWLKDINYKRVCWKR